MWIGFVLSIAILLCTNVSTPLCQMILNSMGFDELLLIKALMVSVLLCILFLSFLWARQRYASPLRQIKKVLKWQATLRDLEKSCFSLERKTQILNTLSQEMNLDLDLVAHYPQEFKQIEGGDDCGTAIEVLKRVLDVYSKTLSDAYYRRKYYSMGRTEF